MAAPERDSSDSRESSFDWDDANIAHISEHDVLPAEAEEIVVGNPLDLDYSVRNGEPRFRQVGETVAGRVLAVITTERKGLTRVVTAYPASPSLFATWMRYKETMLYGKAGSA
jgi:uncharacterized DUF497 family protein